MSFIRFDNYYYFQESLSGQQSSFYANNEFIGGTKSTDFSSIQGNGRQSHNFTNLLQNY